MIYYKVTIEKLTENSESKYPDKQEVYNQVITDLAFDVKKAILAINGLINSHNEVM